MKLACVDKSAVERLALQRVFQDAYERCKASVGHISLFSSYPASKDEVLFSSPPDIIAIGAGFSVEESYSACRDLHRTYPHTPIFLFLKPESYSLRVLQRFRGLTAEIFALEDSAIRIVDKLSTYSRNVSSAKNGKLIVVEGVKGGVGTTSIVSGLAHAAQAIGQSAVVLDLSASFALVQYMAAQRWHSPDYSALLTEGIIPERNLVERCITTAPNGISLLLPPSGGTDMREQWLRDANKFEITLAVIDILIEMYSFVLVDLSNAEGVLPFALTTKAFSRLLVTSNDPASVHLLNCRLNSSVETPGDANLHVLINMLNENSLNKEDVLDFLYSNENFLKQMALLEPVPFDAKARNWIGTGNTFYTEGSAALQGTLEVVLNTLASSRDELCQSAQERISIFESLKKISWGKNESRRKSLSGTVKALPFLGRPVDANSATFKNSNGPDPEHDHSIPKVAEPLEVETKVSAATQVDTAFLYQAPQLITEKLGERR